MKAETGSLAAQEAFFQKRLDYLKNRAEKDEKAREALALAEKLEEPNAPGLWQLVELFGLERVKALVEEALALYRQAWCWKRTGARRHLIPGESGYAES